MNLSISRYHRRLLLVVVASWALSAIWFLLLFLINSGIVKNSAVSFCTSASFVVALLLPGVTIIVATLRWCEHAPRTWGRVLASGCTAFVLGTVFLTLPYAMLGPEDSLEASALTGIGFFFSLLASIWPWIVSAALTLMILMVEVVQHRKVKVAGNMASLPSSRAKI